MSTKQLIVSMMVAVLFPMRAFANADVVVDIHFPVKGEVHFSDDFTDLRSGGRQHSAIDIIAEKHTPVYAASGGTIRYMPTEQPSWGYGIFIDGDDGYEYNYIHLNNDTPGTDDGEGGPEFAYAAGLKRGDRVERGQHIGWVGDSGNAEEIASHLHFEIIDNNDEPINPYLSLQKAYAVHVEMLKEGEFDPELEKELAPHINVVLGLTSTTDVSVVCTSGSLVKSVESTAVYYCGADGARYTFPNQKIYLSWYEDFSDVEVVTVEELAKIPLRGVVPYRPGWQLVKITTVPTVYAVSGGAILRPISNPEIAAATFGEDWESQVDDLSDAFFVGYTVGQEITH